MNELETYSVIISPGHEIQIKAHRIEHGDNKLRFYVQSPQHVMIAEFRQWTGWLLENKDVRK